VNVSPLFPLGMVMRMRSGIVEGEVDDMCLCCTKCAVPVGLVGRFEGPTKFLCLLARFRFICDEFGNI
jgi:hypothetical protein